MDLDFHVIIVLTASVVSASHLSLSLFPPQYWVTHRMSFYIVQSQVVFSHSSYNHKFYCHIVQANVFDQVKVIDFV